MSMVNFLSEELKNTLNSGMDLTLKKIEKSMKSKNLLITLKSKNLKMISLKMILMLLQLLLLKMTMIVMKIIMKVEDYKR